MAPRYPTRYPVRWLMTDERLGATLWPALRRLPPGSGVVFRHHATPAAERRALLRRVERIAAARRLVLLVAGGGGAAEAYGTVRGAVGRGAHDRGQAIDGARRGAVLLFVSPVFATRSHPGASALGPARAARIGRGLGAAVIALGGMDERRWRRIARLGFDGWAGIDAWTRVRPTQKRNTVPT